MTQAMRRLAEGDTTIEVPAQDRADEIGQMAKAVLVFRDAAVENARLEREAAEHRAQAERERDGADQAQREAIRQERAIVANSIGVGLAKLAAKDLTYRMATDIPEAYRELQTDFNEAIGQLEEAMRSVARKHERDPVGNAGDIDGGRRPVAAHRAASLQSRRDRGGARANHHDREEIRRRGGPRSRGGRRRRRRTPRRVRSSFARRSARWTPSPNRRGRSARSSA